jgi:hypothetical protein
MLVDSYLCLLSLPVDCSFLVEITSLTVASCGAHYSAPSRGKTNADGIPVLRDMQNVTLLFR